MNDNPTCNVYTCGAPATQAGTINVFDDKHVVPVKYCDEHAEGYRQVGALHPDFIAVNLKDIT